MRLTQSGNERGPNVDGVEVVAAVEDAPLTHVPLTHVDLQSQIYLHGTDEARQKEVLHQDVTLTHIYQEVEVVGGQFREIGLAPGHRHDQFRNHLLCRLQNPVITVAATILGHLLHQDRPDHEDCQAVLCHRLEGDLEDVGGDRFPVVIDHDLTHILDALAHVRPEDAEDSPLRRHHRAVRAHLRQGIGREDGGLPLFPDRGLAQGIVMAGEGGRAEDLEEDQLQSTHRMIEEVHGLMLSRTIPLETTVV